MRSLRLSPSMDRLPTDIITVILAKVRAAKTIFRCRSVCKMWRSIIDSPRFPDLHFTASQGNTPSLLYLPRFYSEIYIASGDKETPYLLKTTKIVLLPCRRECRKAEPPVNGLVFMYSSTEYSYSFEKTSDPSYICNPATRHCLKLPYFNSLKCKWAKLFWGFGFSQVKKEFKVVQIAQSNGTESEIQVYTLGSDSWRSIADSPNAEIFQPRSAFVSGSLHWLAKGEPLGGFESSFSVDILSFNLDSEDSAVIPTPESIFINSSSEVLPQKSEFQLVALGEYLSIGDASFEDYIEIWVMKDYKVNESWIKYSVTKYYMNRTLFEIVQLISSRDTSEILLLYGSCKLASYNIESRESVPLEILLYGYSPPYGISPYFYHIHSYVESLFSLKSANESRDEIRERMMKKLRPRKKAKAVKTSGTRKIVIL